MPLGRAPRQYRQGYGRGGPWPRTQERSHNGGSGVKARIGIRTRVLVRKIQRDENTEGVGFCSFRRQRGILVIWSRDDHIEASGMPPGFGQLSVPGYQLPIQAPYVAE